MSSVSPYYKASLATKFINEYQGREHIHQKHCLASLPPSPSSFSEFVGQCQMKADQLHDSYGNQPHTDRHELEFGNFA